MSVPEKFPVTIKSGSISVRIHKARFKSKEKTYDGYRVEWYEGQKRHRANRSAWADAKELADEKVETLRSGTFPSHQLKAKDVEIYLAARKKLKPLGIPLSQAIEEYVAARRDLDEHTSLADAIRFFKAHAPNQADQKSVQEARDLYIEERRDRVGKRTFETIQHHIDKFAEAFPCQLTDVTHQQIDQWLRGQKLSPRSFNNRRNAIVTFFNWCRKHRYLPDLETDAEKVEKRPVPDDFVDTFTPDDMQRILDALPSKLVPYLTLSAFAGLRPVEARTLTWDSILWDENQIRIRADQATKTLKRRIVPLLPNLKAWLEPHRKERGLVAGFKEPHHMLTRERKKNEYLKWLKKWPQDVLRHSFATYRLALTNNLHELANEMGNSPQIIVKHYRDLASAKDGEAWFAIMPPKGYGT